MKNIVILIGIIVICIVAFGQTPVPGPSLGGSSSSSSSGGGDATTPDYIVVTPASNTYTMKANASSTYWQVTLTATLGAGTLDATLAGGDQLVGWRIVQGGSGSYGFTPPALVLGFPTMDGTFCAGVGDAFWAWGSWNGTNVLISGWECQPASPPANATMRNGTSGIVTFTPGTYTVGSGSSVTKVRTQTPLFGPIVNAGGTATASGPMSPYSGGPTVDGNGVGWPGNYRITQAQTLSFSFMLPLQWDGSAIRLDMALYLYATETNNDTIQWGVSSSCAPTDGNTVTYGTATVTTTTITTATAGKEHYANNVAVPIAGTAGQFCWVKIARNASGTETYVGDIGFHSGNLSHYLTLQ